MSNRCRRVFIVHPLCDLSTFFFVVRRFALVQILSDQDLDDKIENIHARLRQVKKDLDEDKVPLPFLAITKQLTKNPEDYPDKKSLPHVQVAIRMNSTMTQTKKFKQGDTIAYVICEVRSEAMEYRIRKRFCSTVFAR